jgi:hypothetical protein
MNKQRKIELLTQMFVCREIIKDLLLEISALETDKEMSSESKLSEIKKIREQLSKVGTEIDNLKKEIKLLTTCDIN